MSIPRAFRRSVILCAVSGLLFGCDGGGHSPSPAPASSLRPEVVEKDVLATVNGTPIREVDVLYKLRSDSHQTEMKPDFRKNLLEGIIREQLAYERAVELGLDSDRSYQEEVRKLEAQLAAVKRKALGDLFFQKEIAAKAEVSDADVKRYFDDHVEWFRTDLHLLQILRRSETSIEEARAALAKGVPFDEVARGDSPPPPEGTQKPWDLGYVKLSQVPEPWQKVAESLKAGETSDVIRGPKDRFWIIKLVARRQGPEVSFEAIQPALASRLKAAKIEELREKTERNLRDRARVVYLAPAP